MTINPFDIIKLLFLFICINSHSQQNYTSNNIKSVKLLNSKTNSNYPIINFKDQLELSFDDLEADEKDYYYKINHFDYNWKPSGLLKLEFLEDGGFVFTDKHDKEKFYTSALNMTGANGIFVDRPNVSNASA